jgi:hypothetical protein
VDLRRIASRAHKKLPLTLTANTRFNRVSSRIFDARLLFDDTGIVHQRSHRPERFVHRIEQLNDIGLELTSGRHGDRLSSGLRDIIDHAGRRCAVLHVTDAHGIAALRGATRWRGADSAAAAGDDEILFMLA